MEGDSVSENATVASYVGKSSWTRWPPMRGARWCTQTAIGAWSSASSFA